MPINYSKYPPDWKKEIVPRILQRAENCCEFCGLENYAEIWSVGLWLRDNPRYKFKRIWLSTEGDMLRIKEQVDYCDIKKIRVVLTIAHLDHDEENHDVSDERLKALCQSCHLNYDAKEKIRRINAKAS
jgi:hypothetical protein